MALFAQARRALIGEPVALDGALVQQFPELGNARYRRGGLPPRVGGWCLGARSVAGIALGSTVWLAPDAHLTPHLLLHELEHVRQWRSVRGFAVRYLLACLRHGYERNPYEIEARRYASERLSAQRLT